MPAIEKRRIMHDAFLIGIAIKFVDGILGIIGGSFLMFTGSGFIADIVQRLFRHELVQDPTDIMANYLIHASQSITHGTLVFASAYLMVHGFIKVVLVTGLYLKKLWAYPAAGIILALSIAYQAARFYHTHSVVLLFLTFVDIVIIFLLRSEYMRLKE